MSRIWTAALNGAYFKHLGLAVTRGPNRDPPFDIMFEFHLDYSSILPFDPSHWLCARSLRYTNVLGCKLLRTRVNEQYNYTLAFLAFGEEEDGCVFELTYNHGDHAYTPGDAYAQVAISTTDVYRSAEDIRAKGGNIVREPGPVPGIGTKIVSIRDPDGWKIVLVDAEDFLKELE